MFEKFLSDNVENFRQRYEGTYGFYRDENKKRILVRLDSIGQRECVFVNSAGIDFRLYPDSKKDIGFEFLPPKSAWYNTRRGAIYTQRLAQRQFQRGVTGKNMELNLLNGEGFNPIRLDFDILQQIYEAPVSVKEALESYKNSKSPSVAISPQFGLGFGNNVFLLKENIGTFGWSGTKFTFKLKEPQLWKTEITDALAALQHSAEIS